MKDFESILVFLNNISKQLLYHFIKIFWICMDYYMKKNDSFNFSKASFIVDVVNREFWESCVFNYKFNQNLTELYWNTEH